LTVNPLQDGLKTEMRRRRAPTPCGLWLWVSVLWGWRPGEPGQARKGAT